MTATTAARTLADPPSHAHRAHRTLGPLLAVMVGLNLALHLVIAATGNRIGVLSGLLLAVIALAYAAYLLTLGRALGRVRYGSLVAHVIVYVTVNVGFLLHATVLLALRAPAIQGDALSPIAPGWIGATYVMASVWGIGLLSHLMGAVMSRGFEAPAR